MDEQAPDHAGEGGIDMHLGRVGLIARFKPLHTGTAALLEAACEQADEVVIGIGSANKYNVRNPFTADESAAMVHAFLSPRFNNYQVIQIPDFAHDPRYRDGQRWKQYVVDHFGDLDAFLTTNGYVRDLLGDTYTMIASPTIIPIGRHVRLRATQVRMEMARGLGWKDHVPVEVFDYITKNGIDERFRREFGLATLSVFADHDYHAREDANEERRHTYER